MAYQEHYTQQLLDNLRAKLLIMGSKTQQALDDAAIAVAVSRYDDETAQMMVNIFQKLMQAVGDRTLEPWDSMHIVLITRALDRVCRRAENIAEHAYFMVEGVSLKHRRTLPQGWEK